MKGPQFAVKNGIKFARWLKAQHPDVYAKAKAIADSQTANLGGLAADDSGWFSKFLSAAGSLGTTYLALDAQKKQLAINLQRAQTGLPPIDLATAPVLTTNVQVPPDVVQKITDSAGMNINKILLFAGVGIAAFLLLKKR